MRKLVRLMIPMVLFALLVCVFGVVSFAETNDGGTTAVYTIKTGDAAPVEYNSNELKMQNVGSDSVNTVITLYGDVTLYTGTTADGNIKGNVTFNLNGHTLTLSAKASNGSYYRYNMASNASLTINGGSGAEGDTTIGNVVTAKGGSVLFASNKCTINFNYANVTVPNTFLDFRVGTLNIVGGTWSSSTSGKIINFAGQASAVATANMKNVTFNQPYNSASHYLFEVGRNDNANTTFTLNFDGCTLNTSAGIVFYNISGKTSGYNAANDHKIVLKNTVVNTTRSDARLLQASSNACITDVIIDEGCTINVPYYGKLSSTNRVVFADGVNPVYSDATIKCTTVKGAPENAYLITYKSFDGEKILAQRYMVKDSALGIPTYYEYTSKEFTVYTVGGWKNGDTAVTTATEDMTVTAGAEAAKAYWVALNTFNEYHDFTIAHIELDSNNMHGNFGKGYRYIKLYSNVKLDSSGSSSAISVTATTDLDLNGYALTMGETAASDYAFRPAKGVTFIIKNGTINMKKSRLAYMWSSDDTLEVNNCTVYVEAQTLIDCRSNKTTISFIDTDIILKGAGGNQLFVYNNNAGAQQATYNFTNVNITTYTNSVTCARLFWFNRPQADNNCTINITNMSIDARITTGIFACETTRTAGTAATIIADGLYINTYQATPKLFVTGSNNTSADGTILLKMKGIVAVANAAIWNTNSQTTVGILSDEIFTKLGNGAKHVFAAQKEEVAYYTYTDAYQTENWTFNGNTYTTYTNAGSVPYLDARYTTSDGKHSYYWYFDTKIAGLSAAVAGKTVSITATEDMFSSFTGYMVYDGSGNLMYKIPINGKLANNLFNVGEKYTYVIYSDFVVEEASATYIANGVTVDLNGYVMDLDSAGNYSNRISPNGAHTFTVKNGTIKTNHNFVYIDSTGAVVNFEGIDFVRTGGGVVSFDIRNGTINLTNCRVVDGHAGQRVFNTGYRGGTQTINLNNCEFNCGNLLGSLPLGKESNGTVLAPYVFNTTVVINGGTYNTTGQFIYVTDNVAATAQMNITVKGGAKINAAKGAILHELKNCTSTATYENCELNFNPANGGTDNYTVGEGLKIMKTSDATYGYKVGAVTLALSSNLTLYSDFNLNIFLGNNVTKVMVGETELELEEYDAKTVKTAVKAIAPNNAANDIVFTVTYVDGGVTYTVDIAYSVVKYAQALLAGSYSAESKALVASAVKYIDTAYAVADAEKPATLTALTASAGYTAAIATASNVAKDAIDGAGNYTALAVAINSAQLRLTDDYKYVLNLNATYTGTLTVNGVAYRVVNGTVGGKTYVTVTLRGYEFNDGLTVTATTADGAVEGTYTLADYVEAMANGTDADLDALLVALYNFTVEAKEYNEFVKANGLK